MRWTGEWATKTDCRLALLFAKIVTRIIIVMKSDEMDQFAGPLSALSSLPVGARARIAAIDGGRNLTRRLLALGLRVGSEVQLLHHRGRGVVIASAGNRIALGGGVAEKLRVAPLSLDSQ
jgi:ferrous iron transport protein A